MRITKRGFTLVELLVVVSVLLISMGVAGDLIISVIRSYNKTRILNEIEQNGNFIMAKIGFDSKNAQSATITPTQLVLRDTPNPGDVITYYVQFGSPGVMRRSYDPIAAGSPTVDEIMTNNDTREGVTLSCQTSICFQLLSSDPVTVNVRFTLAQGPTALGGISSTQSINFDSSVVLRSN